MKKYISLFVLLGGFMVSSCSDFLERKPLDFGDQEVFLKTTADLKYYANQFYPLFPSNKANADGGPYRDDENSDNQTSFWSNSNFFPGVKEVPKLGDSSEWKFTTIRACNFFINLVTERIEANEVIGTPSEINHYLGEVYFFRAYDNFRLLRNYGDVPIIEEVLPDKLDILKISTRRAPRNEVARFIIRDLERADSLMLAKTPEAGRLHKDCAKLLLARVALFEATWEKYHAGTCFVPGNAKWVGAKMHPDFRFQAGSAEKEVEFFLDKAIEYSDLVAGTRTLSSNYKAMFTSVSVDAIPEVLLAKNYISGVNGHGVNRMLSLAGKTGYTRSLIESFLMKNGLPIYDPDSRYQTDVTIEKVIYGRDNRLVESLNPISLPRIYSREAEYTPTGYQVSKWLSDLPGQTDSATGGTTANPIFRAAEAYCIYLEAYYERHKTLGGNCDTYWKALRTRAQVDTDYQKTIDHTDLSKERDLAAKTKGIDATLYNIRRERRCEFIAEGMRLDDLRRWRALDNMRNYEIMGMNLWEEMFKRYAMAGLSLKPTVVSQYDAGDPESTYIKVFKVNESDKAYNGYNFPKPHYLEPIPLSEILLTADDANNPENSNIYQNPGWPISSGSLADYTYDCD